MHLGDFERTESEALAVPLFFSHQIVQSTFISEKYINANIILL